MKTSTPYLPLLDNGSSNTKEVLPINHHPLLELQVYVRKIFSKKYYNCFSNRYQISLAVGWFYFSR